MWRVVFTDIAEEDLHDAYHYIADFLKSPKAAETLLDEAEAAIAGLASFPLSCSLVPDDHFSDVGVRMLAIRNYLAFYTADESNQEVTVIRFLYGRRDWVKLLKNEVHEVNVESDNNA